MSMSQTVRPTRWKRLVLVGVLFHFAFLVTASFEHHDIICHLKTPLHCTACASSPLSSDPHTPDIAYSANLADAGAPVAFLFMEKGTVLAVRSPGRSPPAFV